jgi:cytochrome c oxidase subunit I+III
MPRLSRATCKMLGYDPSRIETGIVHLGIGAFMAGWCLLRLWLGMIDCWRALTLHLCLVWWRFTAATALPILALVAGFPHAV